MAKKESDQAYSSGVNLNRYDTTTIVLHWLTVALVIVLFGLAESWSFLKHGTPLRKELQSLHISLGILLTAVFMMRLGWRVTRGRRLPAAEPGLLGLAAETMLYTLYFLITVEIVLGFLYRWAQAESFMFFGLFPIQFATTKNSALDHAFDNYHNILAWTIIVLACLHASAALTHHYIIKDSVLKRMLPK